MTCTIYGLFKSATFCLFGCNPTLSDRNCDQNQNFGTGLLAVGHQFPKKLTFPWWHAISSCQIYFAECPQVKWGKLPTKLKVVGRSRNLWRFSTKAAFWEPLWCITGRTRRTGLRGASQSVRGKRKAGRWKSASWRRRPRRRRRKSQPLEGFPFPSVFSLCDRIPQGSTIGSIGFEICWHLSTILFQAEHKDEAWS